MHKTLLLSAFSLALSSFASAQTIVNGDFSDFTGSSPFSYSSEISTGKLYKNIHIQGWENYGGSYIYESNAGEYALKFSTYARSSPGSNGAKTSFSILSSGSYILTFDSYSGAGGSATGSARVSIDGSYYSFNEIMDNELSHRSLQLFLTAGEHDLAFENGANGGRSVFIDNVKISSVPEASSSALLGLAGISLLLRRKR